MNRDICAFVISILLMAAPHISPADTFNPSKFHLIDLTYAFNEETIYWPTAPTTFELKKLAYGQTDKGYFYAAYAICAPEHGGTHLDSPIHFSEGQRTTDQIPLQQFMAHAVVIDVSTQAAIDRDYRLTRQDVLEFEAKHGVIEPGTIVLLRTGWGEFWPDRKAYLGDDTPGDVSKLHFPGYGEAAARLLVGERKVSVLGADVASIDYGQSKDFPVHRLAAENNVLGLENLANLERLPARGAVVIALPMKIEGGSGGPVRAIALLPSEGGP
ncbi:MAG: cyclase family protein [Gammaproteobacteria bacterium]